MKVTSSRLAAAVAWGLLLALSIGGLGGCVAETVGEEEEAPETLEPVTPAATTAAAQPVRVVKAPAGTTAATPAKTPGRLHAAKPLASQDNQPTASDPEPSPWTQ